MLRAENSFAARTDTTANDVEPPLADVAFRAHLGAREDPEEAHRPYGRFVLLFGRTFAMVHTTMVAQPPCPAGENCGGVCDP